MGALFPRCRCGHTGMGLDVGARIRAGRTCLGSNGLAVRATQHHSAPDIDRLLCADRPSCALVCPDGVRDESRAGSRPTAEIFKSDIRHWAWRLYGAARPADDYRRSARARCSACSHTVVWTTCLMWVRVPTLAARICRGTIGPGDRADVAGRWSIRDSP